MERNPTYDSLKKGYARMQHQRDAALRKVADLTEELHDAKASNAKAHQVIGALRQALAHASEEVPDRYDPSEWEERKRNILDHTTGLLRGVGKHD